MGFVVFTIQEMHIVVTDQRKIELLGESDQVRIDGILIGNTITLEFDVEAEDEVDEMIGLNVDLVIKHSTDHLTWL